MRILVINGPNLNLLGTRETHLYGSKDFEGYLEILRKHFEGFQIDYFQSNWEGAIIDKLQEAAKDYDGVVINPGGYTHTSVAIADAIGSIKTPVVEVHITNILDREDFRHTSITGSKCTGSVMGFGLDSYRLGIESLRVMKLNLSK